MGATDSSASVGVHKNLCIYANLCWPPLTWCFRYSMWGSPNMLPICSTMDQKVSSCNCIWYTVTQPCRSESVTHYFFQKIYHWNRYFIWFGYSVMNKNTDQLHGRIFTGVLYWGTVGTVHCTQRIWIHSVPLLKMMWYINTVLLSHHTKLSHSALHIKWTDYAAQILNSENTVWLI
jgi:hypothetical protein